MLVKKESPFHINTVLVEASPEAALVQKQYPEAAEIYGNH
jgi:hypothetical protein